MSRILPRYTDPQLTHDPLEILLAQRETAEQQARAAINAGRTPDANAAEHRGIPLIAHGIGGTQPGSSPHGEAAAGHLDKPHRLRSIR